MRGPATAGRLSSWSGPDLEHAGSVDVGAGPPTITSAPDGGRAYVAAVLGSDVTVVDVADPARPGVVATLDVPRGDGPGAHVPGSGAARA